MPRPGAGFHSRRGDADHPVQHLLRRPDRAGGKTEELEGEREASDDKPAAAAVPPTEVHIRSEVIVPTVTCEDAAALSNPPAGSVHLICVDPPYYNNVQYSELSKFFYVWMKRSVGHFLGLESCFREPITESSREAVANEARFRSEADQAATAWQQRG